MYGPRNSLMPLKYHELAKNVAAIGRPTSASVRPIWLPQARNTVLPVLVAFSAKKKIEVDRIVPVGDTRSTADTCRPSVSAVETAQIAVQDRRSRRHRRR